MPPSPLSTTEAALSTLPAREGGIAGGVAPWGETAGCSCAAGATPASAPALGSSFLEHALTAKNATMATAKYFLNMILYAPCMNFFHVNNTIPEKKFNSFFRAW